MGQRNVNINLYPKQAYFVGSEALMSPFLGGVGSGKTHAGAVKALLLPLRLPNKSGHVFLNINKNLVMLKPGEYARVYSAMKNLVYPKLETGRYDEKYFKDRTNYHPVDALRY